MPNQFVASISQKLKDLYGADKDFYQDVVKHTQRIQRAMVSYFKLDKLPTLFIEAVDKSGFITFATDRDRRIVNRKLPTYKLVIDYTKIPEELRTLMSMKNTLSDAKSYAVHAAVLNRYIDLIADAVDRHDMEYLKDDVPSKEDMAEMLEFITTMYIITTSDDPKSPIFVRPFM